MHTKWLFICSESISHLNTFKFSFCPLEYPFFFIAFDIFEKIYFSSGVDNKAPQELRADTIIPN